MTYSVHIIPRSYERAILPLSSDAITRTNYLDLAEYLTMTSQASNTTCNLFAVFVDADGQPLLASDNNGLIVHVPLDHIHDDLRFNDDMAWLAHRMDTIAIDGSHGFHLIGMTPFTFSANHLRALAESCANLNTSRRLQVLSLAVVTDADIFCAPTFNQFPKEESQ